MSKVAIPKAWHPSEGLASFVLGIARHAEIGRGIDEGGASDTPARGITIENVGVLISWRRAIMSALDRIGRRLGLKPRPRCCVLELPLAAAHW